MIHASKMHILPPQNVFWDTALLAIKISMVISESGFEKVK